MTPITSFSVLRGDAVVQLKSGGAPQDALANAVSDFMKEVEEGLLGEYFWVVGDEAYPISEFIIAFPSSTPTEE